MDGRHLVHRDVSLRRDGPLVLPARQQQQQRGLHAAEHADVHPGIRGGPRPSRPQATQPLQLHVLPERQNRRVQVDVRESPTMDAPHGEWRLANMPFLSSRPIE